MLLDEMMKLAVKRYLDGEFDSIDAAVDYVFQKKEWDHTLNEMIHPVVHYYGGETALEHIIKDKQIENSHIVIIDNQLDR